MRVLFISPDFDYNCGITQHILTLIKYLKEIKDIELYVVSNRGNAVSEINKFDIPFKQITFYKGIKNIFNYHRFLNELEKFCIDNRIDIIHTFHRYPELLSNKISKRLRIKTITTNHSIVKNFHSLSFKSKKIIAISSASEDNLINTFRIPDNKIIKIYNCVDTQKFDISLYNSSDDRKKNEIKLLFVGRGTSQKGIDVLLEAYKLLQQKNDNIKLYVASNPIEEKFKSIIEELGITVLPIIPNPAEYYKKADIIVHPSREETFSTVMLESALMKKIFIGSDIPGISEFIKDNETGFLIRNNNPKQLIKIILDIIEGNVETKRIIENAYQNVKRFTDCEGYALKVHNIYKELLSEDGKF